MKSVFKNLKRGEIGQHIKKVLDDGELVEAAVIKKYFITAADGKQYSTKHYNLQMIIAVGFKVNNDRAEQDALGCSQTYSSGADCGTC